MAENYLIIRNKKIPIKSAQLEVTKLKFFPDNPRIYSAIGAGQSAPTQEEIQEKLLKMDHVKDLIHDIKLNGGLIDPIIVKDGSFEVLEGNSRLAAYRELITHNPQKWGKIRSTILPKDVDETTVFALLGQYHIKGKKDWLPFEQAGFLHRRHKNQNVETEELAKELGLKVTEARNLVATYDFMVENNIQDSAKWSYFFEYLKSRKIKKYRREFDNLDDLIVQKIKNDHVGKAMDFRDGLKLLGEADPKIVKKFINNQYTFTEATSAVKTSGNANEVYKRLNSFRMWLNKEETKEALICAKEEEKSKIQFELGKIRIAVSKYHNK